MWETRLIQSKAVEDVPKVPIDVSASVPIPPLVPATRQQPALRTAPPAHQHHQPLQPGALQQPGVQHMARHAMPSVLNLQGTISFSFFIPQSNC